MQVHTKKNFSNQNEIAIKSCINNLIVNIFILVSSYLRLNLEIK